VKNVIVLTATIGPLVCSIFSWYFLFPIYLKEIGASDRTINVLYFIFNLTFYIAQVLGGILSDKFGRKPIVVGTTLLYALSGYGIIYSKDWLSASLFYAVAPFSSSIQAPAIYALTFESQNARGLAFGMTSFSYNLGLALGPLLGALLFEKIGISGLLKIYSITALVVGIIRWLFLEETLKAKEVDPKHIRINLDRKKTLTFIGGSFFFLSLSLTINGPYISLFQKEILNYSQKEINLVFTQMGIACAIASLIFGKMADHMDSAKAWAVTSLLHPLLLLGWVMIKGSLILLVGSAIFAEMAYIAYPIFVSSIFEESIRAKGLGMFGFVTGSIGSLSPLLLNIFEGQNLNIPFILATIFGLMSFSVIIKLGGDRNEHKQK